MLNMRLVIDWNNVKYEAVRISTTFLKPLFRCDSPWRPQGFSEKAEHQVYDVAP